MTDVRLSQPSLPGVDDRMTMPGRERDAGALPPINREAPPAAVAGEALRLGFLMGRARVFRRSTAVSAVLGAALVVVAGVIERHAASAGAVDRALAATFNLVVPLLSFGIAAEAAGRGNLRDGVWSVARYGVARRDVALGLIASAAVASAALCAALAMLAVIVAHGEGNPPVAGDLLTSAWIAALAAAAYTGWFALGSTFGRRGGGRWAALVADFVVGASAGIAGAVLPRGHVLSLLGGAAPLAMPQMSSSLLLGASAVVLAALAAVRCRE
jgi:hypothetical protein